MQNREPEQGKARCPVCHAEGLCQHSYLTGAREFLIKCGWEPSQSVWGYSSAPGGRKATLDTVANAVAAYVIEQNDKLDKLAFDAAINQAVSELRFQLDEKDREIAEWKELQNQAHDAAMEAEAEVARLKEAIKSIKRDDCDIEFGAGFNHCLDKIQEILEPKSKIRP